MNDYELLVDSICESMVISKPDTEWKLDDFIHGNRKILLVTGLSGSGKSTYAYKLQDDMGGLNKVIVIQMDHFWDYSGVGRKFCANYTDPKNSAEMNKEALKMINAEADIFSKFYSMIPKYRDLVAKAGSLHKIDDRFKGPLEENFLRWIIKNSSSFGKKIIIEGVAIYLEWPYFKYPKDKVAIKIVGTSAIKSQYRGGKRKGESNASAAFHAAKNVCKNRTIRNDDKQLEIMKRAIASWN